MEADDMFGFIRVNFEMLMRHSGDFSVQFDSWVF